MKQVLAVGALMVVVLVGGLAARQSVPATDTVPADGGSATASARTPRVAVAQSVDREALTRQRDARHQAQQLKDPIPDEVRERPPFDRSPFRSPTP